MSEKNTAIILAGGKGKRMNTDIPKQYLEINGRPLICHTLDCFENSFINEIIVVAGEGETDFFQRNIVDKYGYTKISIIVEGGKERYHSVLNGLRAVKSADYVYIHDGARPCVDKSLLERGRDGVIQYGAVIAAVRVKDTIKEVSDSGEILSTPDRNFLWQIQTPQVFRFNNIKEAYETMIGKCNTGNITDDAMVMENYGNLSVHIFEGDYNNIKVTTPEDLEIVKNILKNI